MSIHRTGPAAWLVPAAACALAVLLAATLARAAKPATIRIVGEHVTARIEFENGAKLSLTSKPTPVKPDLYWTKALSLIKKDDKGRTWELRCNGAFGGLANVTVDPEQDKVLLLGGPVALCLQANPQDENGMKVIGVSVTIAGMNSETFFPGAYLDGRTMTMPAVAIKDEGGRILAQGRCTMKENRYAWFSWRYPDGFNAKFDVEVEAHLGPFENKLRKNVTQFPPPK